MRKFNLFDRVEFIDKNNEKDVGCIVGFTTVEKNGCILDKETGIPVEPGEHAYLLLIGEMSETKNHFEEFLESELNLPDKNLSFGQAIASMQKGNLVTRKGWNGKGMFIFMRPADELHVSVVAKEIKSLPQRVKDYYYQDCVDENGNPIDLPKDDVVKFTAYICMKAADGTIVNGWLASQRDMLANDWMIFEF